MTTQIGFHKIVSVKINHSYFADKTCKSIRFKPTQSTSKLMRFLGLIFKNTLDGFLIFAESFQYFSSQLLILENSKVEELLQFEFELEGDFYIYTDLEANTNNFLTYCSDYISNTENEGIIKLLRLPKDYENATSHNLNIVLASLNKIATTKITTDFEIEFVARSIQWRYIIIDKTIFCLPNLRICNSKITFTEPVEIVLNNSTKAFVFSSGEHLIPLSEAYDFYFSLVLQETNEELQAATYKTLIKHLPRPDLNSIRMSNLNGKHLFVSDMYIH
jgi:hypothetical protein